MASLCYYYYVLRLLSCQLINIIVVGTQNQLKYHLFLLVIAALVQVLPQEIYSVYIYNNELYNNSDKVCICMAASSYVPENYPCL